MLFRTVKLGSLILLMEWGLPTQSNPRFWVEGFTLPSTRLIDLGVWKLHLTIELARKGVAA